jgi:hypothetical protein
MRKEIETRRILATGVVTMADGRCSKRMLDVRRRGEERSEVGTSVVTLLAELNSHEIETKKTRRRDIGTAVITLLVLSTTATRLRQTRGHNLTRLLKEKLAEHNSHEIETEKTTQPGKLPGKEERAERT